MNERKTEGDGDDSGRSAGTAHRAISSKGMKQSTLYRARRRSKLGVMKKGTGGEENSLLLLFTGMATSYCNLIAAPRKS